MSKRVKYHVSGRFEGMFKTQQDLALKSGDPFPEGSKHLIQIYRGSITDNRQIDQNEFRTTQGDIVGDSVNNIQINPDEQWPIEHARIFSLKEFKLRNPEISMVQSINGHTYGKITGDIAASVTEGVYEKLDDKEDESGSSQRWWRVWNKPHEGDEARKTADDESEGPDNRHKKASETGNGCGDFFVGSNGCLNRMLWLLFIATVLYLLLNATNWGRQFVCKIQYLRLKLELVEVKEAHKKLEETIAKTKPKLSQCGDSEVFRGKNLQQNFTYTLGQTSGDVIIEYDMFSIPDRMEVIFNGKLIAETVGDYGFASETGKLVFPYHYRPNELHELTIRIIPNQEEASTEWEFKVNCPT